MIDQQQINILMIEDNPGDVRITQVLLRDDPLVDYTFDTFDTLQASINYLNENDTDIILLDLNLPDSSGTETFTRIQEEFPDLPIVIMSGNVDQETAIEAVRLGAQDSLLKGGVDGPSLSRVIRYAIERNRAELALAREKAELGALVYSIGDAVIATKTDCVITRMNPIAEKLTGWSEEEALGKPLIEVFKMVGEDSQKITECPVKQILDSGKLTTQEEPLLLVNKTGEEIAISNSVSIIKDDQGRVTGAVLIFHDDSDRRMSQRLLETRLELIAFASNHSLREFLLEAVDRISGLVDSPGGFYHFVDEAQGTVRMNVFSSGQEQSILKESDQERLMKIDQVEGWAECVRKKKPVIHNDLRHMPAIESIPAEHTPVQRELIVPILRNGKIVAIVGVGNKAADYDGKDIETVSYLADITWEIVNQKRAEEKLSQSEVHYRQIVETAQEGMWIINADNSVAFINQELADLLGYPKEEIIGSNSLNYVLLEDREFLQEKIRNRREGIKESYEIRILRKDGTPLDALISATPNFDDDEEYTGALVMVTDITERKQAERAIALERDRAQKYFDIAGVMLLVLDSEGKIERINEKGLQILGYKKQEDLIGKDWFTTCLPEDLREETRTIHQGLMEDWKDHGEFIESRVLTRDGEERQIAWYNTTIRDHDGYKNIGTLSSGEDITKRVETQRQRELLLDLSRQAAFETDFNKLLFFIAEQTVKIIKPAESASIFLVNEDRSEAEIKAWYGFNEDDLSGMSVPVDNSVVTGRVIKSKKSKVIPDISKEPGFVDIEKGNLDPISSVMAVPILSKENKSVGVIFCDSRSRTDAFNSDNVNLLESISAQLAGVIENTRLLKELNSQHKALQKSESEYRNLFNTIFNGFALHEMIYDENGNPIDYCFLEINPAFSEMTGLSEEKIIGKTVMEVLPETEPYWIESYAEVVKTGKPLRLENYSGALNKHFEVIAFSPADNQFATVISDITERVEAERERELLLELSRTAASEKDFGKLMFYISEQVIKLIPSAQSASLFLINREHQKASIQAWAGFGNEDLAGLELPLTDTVTARVLRTKKATHVPDVSENPDFVDIEFKVLNKIRSSMAAPIIFRDKNADGIIFCDNREKTHAFSDEDLALLESISAQLAGVIENARLLEEVDAQRQSLQVERDRAQNYLDIAEVMIVALDEKGTITMANRKSCDIFGYAEEELIGRNWFTTCVLKDDQKRAKSLYEDFIDSDEVSGPNYEQVFLTKQGSNRIAMWQSRKLFDENGKTTGTLSSGEDITERKQAEEALKQYERIVSSSSDMMALVNNDLVYLAANNAYCHAFSLEKDDLIGMSGPDLFEEKFFQEIIRPHIDRCLQGEEVVYYEWTDYPELGNRYTETHYYPYYGTGDTILGLVTNRRDITEQHRIQQALQFNEQRLSNIVNNSTNLFYSHSPQHEITYISPQSDSMLGYTPDEMMRKWTELVTDNPINNEGIKHTQTAIKTGKPQPPYELELRAKSGRRVWVEVHEAPIVEDEKVIEMVGSLTDITSRRRAEMENRQNMAALKIANLDLRAAKDRIQGTMEATIRTIAKTVEVRDPYTAGHHRRVSELSVMIAGELGLEDETRKAIELAAVIHDLGKIQVPAEILSKPGRLTDIEFGLVKTHPTVGYDLLKNIQFPWPLAEIIYMHHERMDGTGYPQGLSADEIPIESRIIGVADTVEAMSSHRPYRPALGLDRALEQIRTDRGTLYDPRVVDACIQVFEAGFEFSAGE